MDRDMWIGAILLVAFICVMIGLAAYGAGRKDGFDAAHMPVQVYHARFENFEENSFFAWTDVSAKAIEAISGVEYVYAFANEKRFTVHVDPRYNMQDVKDAVRWIAIRAR